jgi:hypothetical protein
MHLMPLVKTAKNLQRDHTPTAYGGVQKSTFYPKDFHLWGFTDLTRAGCRHHIFAQRNLAVKADPETAQRAADAEHLLVQKVSLEG